MDCFPASRGLSIRAIITEAFIRERCMLTIHFGDMDGVVYNTSVYCYCKKARHRNQPVSSDGFLRQALYREGR